MRTPAIERRVGDAEWAVLKEQMGIADVDRHPIGVLIGGADTKMDTSVPHPDDENLIGIALAYAGFTALHHVRAHLRPGFRATYFPQVAHPIWREFPLTAAAETRPLRRRAGRELGAVDP